MGFTSDVKAKNCAPHFWVSGDSVYCPGTVITLTIQASSPCSGGTCNWYKNGLLITTNHTRKLIINDTGTYYGVSVQYPLDRSRDVNVRYISQSNLQIITKPTVCIGTPTTYSINSVAGTLYNWILPNGWTGSSTSNIITATADSSGQIGVELSTPCGIFLVTKDIVPIQNPVPITPPIYGNTNVCSGIPTTFSVAPQAGALFYYWYAPGWNLSTNGNNIVTVVPPNVGGNISLSVQTVCGYSPTQILPISVSPTLIPSVNLIATDTIVCANSNVVVTANVINADSNAVFEFIVNGITQQMSTQNTFSASSFQNNDSVVCRVHTYNSCQTDSIATSNAIRISIYNSNPNIINYATCSNYILNSQTYTSSGTYTQTLTNANGCDSILTLNLTIDTIDVSVTIGNATIFANQNGATYQWLDCNNNFAPITSETNQSITGFLGDCAVMITINGCTDTSACVNLFTTSINQVAITNEEVTIYPNPTTHQFQVSSTKYKVVAVSIYNVVGEQVLQSAIKNPQSEISINVSGLMRGVYIVEVSTEQGVVRKKLIKE